MATFTVVSTPNIRSLYKRRKSDLVHKVHMLEDFLEKPRTQYDLKKTTAYDLARDIMQLHREIPPENN